jgi:hypothetical protein
LRSFRLQAGIVTVEHVDVHAGGQAVVGLVESPRGGDQPKSEDQPRAKQIGHAPQPALRSADKERQPLPVSGDAERPLPDARQRRLKLLRPLAEIIALRPKRAICVDPLFSLIFWVAG